MDLQEHDKENKHGDDRTKYGRAPYGDNNENLRTIVRKKKKYICIYDLK